MAIRKRRVLGIAALITLGAVTAVAGYFYSLHRHAEWELHEVVAALDRDDPGWRLADLQQFPARPPGQDSAALILKLHARIPKGWSSFNPEEGDWQEMPPGEPLPDKTAALLRAKTAKVEALLPDLRTLADHPRGRFRITYSRDIIGTLLPHVQQVREVANVLQHDAYVRVLNEDHSGALDSCRAIVGAARSFDEEPLLISQLVRAAVLQVAMSSAQHTLAAGVAAPRELEALQRALEQAERVDMFRVAMRGERAAMHEMFTNLSDGTVSLAALQRLMGAPGSSATFEEQVTGYAAMATLRRSHVWMLRHINEVIDADRLPPAQRDARLKELYQAPVHAPMLAKMFTPGWVRCHEGFLRCRARCRCASVALAAERYRLKYGAWPVSLGGLAPEFLKEVPTDPYTGASLACRQVPNGVVFFSVGPDRKLGGDFYDGPLPVSPAPGSRAAEFEFRLWDPDLRGLPLAERRH